jgi:hypothetical protein
MENNSRKRKPKKIIVSTDSSEEHVLGDGVDLNNPRENSRENSRENPKENEKENPKENPRDNSKRNSPNGNNLNTGRAVPHLTTKHVIKPTFPDSKVEKTSPAMYILGIVFLVIIVFVFSMSNSPNSGGNVSELATRTFTSNLPKGNGHISSADFAEQITNSFRTQSPNKALSLLAVGSNLGVLKNSISQFGNALCGNVVYLEGKDSNDKFAKDLMGHAKKFKKEP